MSISFFLLQMMDFYYLLLNFLYYCFQEANKRNNNWLPPPWAIAAMVVLGFNEFMTLLRFFSSFCIPTFIFPRYMKPGFSYFELIFVRNPLWLLFIFVSYLLLKALWVQLDISGEFRNGAVSLPFKNLNFLVLRSHGDFGCAFWT